MAHRFESDPNVTARDAMSDDEVKEVLARLAQEKVLPKVQDVADIAGASEADVRRVLGQLRAEQASVAVPSVSPAFANPWRMRTSPRVTVALVAVMTLALMLLALMSMRMTAVPAPPHVEPPQEVPTMPSPADPLPVPEVAPPAPK